MKVVFMGTPEFAVPSLSLLAKTSHNIVGIVTQPDRPKGRSKVPSPSPIKERALGLGLKVMQPVNVNDAVVVKQLQNLASDCIVVVAFGQFLSSSIINFPRHRCINIHASLLPKYRGAAPINWAIIRGETVTGVTSMLMTVKMDAGDIIMQNKTSISPDETAGELEKRLSLIGADLLVETLDLIETGSATYTKQNDNDITIAPKLKKEDGLINWSQETQKVHNLIRGLTSSPGAYTYFCSETDSKELKDRKRIIIQKTQIHDRFKVGTSLAPGTVVEITSCGIHVATLDGFICITQLQPEGKRIMDAQEYLRGYKVKLQDTFIS
jgi:methionyl-tRNA formyltransferase